jgi:hypothetical protein
MPASSKVPVDPFLAAFRGGFTSALRWPQLDALWERVRTEPVGWYVYAVGEAPPDAVVDTEQLLRFVEEIDALLRREHDEDYCGIVYADEPEAPLPGWVLSRLAPVDLKAVQTPTAGRRRWWQRLFG